MFAAQQGRQWSLLNPESATLLEIAALLDDICEVRRAEDVTADIDETDVRRELFELLDQPGQSVWERVREMELYPAEFPGLGTRSPLGITVGDLAYEFGLGDIRCPARQQLMEVLRWGLTEHHDPLLAGRAG